MSAGDPFALFDRLQELPPDRLATLVEAWRAVDPADRRRAWAAVKVAARRSGRERQLDEVREVVEGWARRGYAGIDAGIFGRMTNLDVGETRLAWAPPILDAMAAELLRDVLPAEELATLSLPAELATEGRDADEPG
jgi:hypothetical protein